MALSYQNQPFRVCPRCRVALPLHVVVCYNCGYTLAPLYTENMATGNQQAWTGSAAPTNQWAENTVPQQGWAANSIGSNPPSWAENPAPASQPLPERRRREDREKKRAGLIYFGISLLAVFALVFAGLRGAHITPGMLENMVLKTNPPRKIIYAPPKATPLFSDPLINDASGWNLQSSPGEYVVAVGSAGLTLESDQHKLLWELLPGERSYGNFTLVVNAALTKGEQNNGYGVYIRGTADKESDLATYYRFELYGDGSYAIFKGVVNNNGVSSAIKIAGYTLNPAIQKAGKVNHLMIVAKGASLALIVNGKMVKSIDDSSYAAGSIALFVSNLLQASAGAQAQFSQLAIYPTGQ